MLYPAYKIVDVNQPEFFTGSMDRMFEIVKSCLQNKRYKIIINVITVTNDGTITEFISTHPFVSRKRAKDAIIAIIIEPTILGIPKN